MVVILVVGAAETAAEAAAASAIPLQFSNRSPLKACRMVEHMTFGMIVTATFRLRLTTNHRESYVVLSWWGGGETTRILEDCFFLFSVLFSFRFLSPSILVLGL